MEKTKLQEKLYSKRNDWVESAVKILTLISLAFSVTNYVFISAISALAVVFLFPLMAKNGLKVSEFTFFLLFLFAFYLISAIIVNPAQVISFDFYRRDGNFFITFLPLLVLSVCAVKFEMWVILPIFTVIGTIANVVGLGKFLIFGGSNEYFMLFTAHNAAGGFLAMLAIVNVFVISHYKKGMTKLFYIGCLLVNLFGLYLTNSRGSILPIAIAFIVYFLMKFSKKADIIVVSVIFILTFIFVAFILFVRGDGVIKEPEGSTIPQEYYSNGFYTFIFSLLNRSWTLITRLFYLWPRALYLFLQSPLFGIGFGAYNDIEYNLVGINGIFTINHSVEFINSDAHAHNTYFHLLAETGIFGIVMFVIFLIAMRNKIFKEKDATVKSMLFVMFIFALISSFFEHRFTTPSQMLPFILLLGMSISNGNYISLKEKKERETTEYKEE